MTIVITQGGWQKKKGLRDICQGRGKEFALGGLLSLLLLVHWKPDMLRLDGSTGTQESITEQISARIAKLMMVSPPRKQDLALMEREETGGVGMKEVRGTCGRCVREAVGKDPGL